MARETNLAGGFVAPHQEAAREPSMYPDMFENARIWRARTSPDPYAEHGIIGTMEKMRLEAEAKPKDPFGVSMMGGMGMMEQMVSTTSYDDDAAGTKLMQTTQEAMKAQAPGSQAANPYAENEPTETIRQTAAKPVDPFQGMVMERTQAKIAQRGSSFPNKASPLQSHALTDAERASCRKLWEECEKEAAEKEIAQYKQTLSGHGLTSDQETENDSSEVVPVSYWKAESREMGMRSSPAGFPGQVNDSDETTESDQTEGRHHTVKGKAKGHFDFFTSKNSSRQNITREESPSDGDGSDSPVRSKMPNITEGKNWVKGIVGGKKKSRLQQRSESRLRTRDENRTAALVGPMYKNTPSGYTLTPDGDTAVTRTQRHQDPIDNDNTATIGSPLGAKYYHLPIKNGLPRTRCTRALDFDTENTDTTGSVMTAPTQRYHDPTDDALTPTIGSAMTRIQRSHVPSEEETTEGHSTEDYSTEGDPTEVDPATIGLAMTARGRIENY